MIFNAESAEPQSTRRKYLEGQMAQVDREALEVVMEDNDITEIIIGAAIEVHKLLGPGLLEATYEICLAYEIGKEAI